MSEYAPEQIQAAADWWGERLTNCRHSGLSAQERGRPEKDSYQFAEMLMTIARPSVTDEQIERFKSALVSALAADTYEARYGVLDVDYGPCKLLSDALEAAEIPNRSTLPIKTIMWLRDGTVTVSYGYGAPIETIYPRAS